MLINFFALRSHRGFDPRQPHHQRGNRRVGAHMSDAKSLGVIVKILKPKAQTVFEANVRWTFSEHPVPWLCHVCAQSVPRDFQLRRIVTIGFVPGSGPRSTLQRFHSLDWSRVPPVLGSASQMQNQNQNQRQKAAHP